MHIHVYLLMVWLILTALNSRSMSREIVDTQAKNHRQLLDNDHSSFGRGHRLTTLTFIKSMTVERLQSQCITPIGKSTDYSCNRTLIGTPRTNSILVSINHTL